MSARTDAAPARVLSQGRTPAGRLVLVSAITPTPAGEGKTTCSSGLAQGLALIGRQSAVALREPSLGPYLGLKGGGTGGGASQLLPADDINMHFTVQVENRIHLAQLMKRLRTIPEVVRINRIKGANGEQHKSA